MAKKDPANGVRRDDTGVPAPPAEGGARTLEELEALARQRAGLSVDPAALAPCDRPKGKE